MGLPATPQQMMMQLQSSLHQAQQPMGHQGWTCTRSVGLQNWVLGQPANQEQYYQGPATHGMATSAQDPEDPKMAAMMQQLNQMQTMLNQVHVSSNRCAGSERAGGHG